MSWADHLKAQLVTKGVNQCALIGAGDGAIWADINTRIQPAEAKAIAALFRNPSSAFATGVTIAGVKFLVTRASDDTIAARKEARGLFLCKSNKAIVLAMHDASMEAGTCSTHAGKASDYFKKIGF